MAEVYTLETITAELAGDDKVKLAGVDVDGQLRGKYMWARSTSAWYQTNILGL